MSENKNISTPIPFLPLKQAVETVETREVLKRVAEAQKFLGELKGVSQTIPNEEVLLNLLPLQEAQASSEIENIVTTMDDLYRSRIENNLTSNVKEVNNYEKALLEGFNLVRGKNNKEKRLLTNNYILNIQGILIPSQPGFRKTPGTQLKDNLGKLVYTPPQDPNEIVNLMANLEKFINDDSLSDLDPLVKMAIIHHQFETIHPFYDGNGRIGRIINILYLYQKDLLDFPILYLSRYLVESKQEYYRLLQEVREKENWEEWILFILLGVKACSIESISLVKQVTLLMNEYKHRIRKKYSKVYSQDLINALFKYPYTRIEFIVKDLKVTRQTAKKYLESLAYEKLLEKVKLGRNNYYINQQLINLAIDHRKIFWETLKKHVKKS